MRKVGRKKLSINAVLTLKTSKKNLREDVHRGQSAVVEAGGSNKPDRAIGCISNNPGLITFRETNFDGLTECSNRMSNTRMDSSKGGNSCLRTTRKRDFR